MGRHHLALTATAAVIAVSLGGCVDMDIAGTYEHPEGGVIILGDDSDGTYILFEGQTRVIEGNHEAPSENETLHGSTDARSWDSTYIDWRSKDDVVTLRPEGGPQVEGLMVEGDLVMLPGPDSQGWRFSVVEQPFEDGSEEATTSP